MEYNGEGIQALVCALDEMQNAPLIQVDEKLRKVLKCLAYYDEFRKVLAYCNQSFDFEQEKKNVFGKLGDTDVLRLPRNSKILVALVSNMLVEFDTNSKDIVSFSGQYFPAERKQDSYAAFFEKVMEPFKFALVHYVVEGFEEEKQKIARSISFASEGLSQQAEYLLVAIANAIKESQLDEVERGEYGTILEGYAAALDSRDSLMIKAIWLGLKKALSAKGFCTNEIKKMDELLKLYLVIK